MKEPLIWREIRFHWYLLSFRIHSTTYLLKIRIEWYFEIGPVSNPHKFHFMSSSLLKIPLKLLLLLFVLAGILLVSLRCSAQVLFGLQNFQFSTSTKSLHLVFTTRKKIQILIFSKKKKQKKKSKTKRKHFQIKNTFSSSKNISLFFLFDLNFFIEIFFFNLRELFGEFSFFGDKFSFFFYFFVIIFRKTALFQHPVFTEFSDFPRKTQNFQWGN